MLQEEHTSLNKMAETDQYEIWSWKEAYPGTNIADYIGQKAADEMGDIQIKVKNKADFLNIENQGHEEYKKQKKALVNYINSIRKKYGETEVPQAQMTEESYQQLKAMKQAQTDLEAYERLREDPLKEFSQRRDKWLQEQDQHSLSIITGLPDLKNAVMSGDWDKFIEGSRKYLGDSLLGVPWTAWRLLPENNKTTWALAGEIGSNLPLYAADKKRFMKQFVQSPGKDPVLSGAVAATAGMGAYAGANLYDMANQITRYINNIPEPELKNDPRLENLVLARNALLFTGGAASLGPLFKGLSKSTAWTLGVSGDKAKKIARIALEQEIPFGIAAASERGAVKAYARVVGVFPFVGTPFKAAKAQINWMLDQKVVNTLNELAPVQTMANIGKLITKDARKKYNAFARINAVLYDNFYANASKLDDLLGAGKTTRYGEVAFEGGPGYIPTDKVKTLAALWKEKTKRGMVRLQGYEQGQPETLGGLQNLEKFESFLANLGRLENHINANQFRAIQKQFNREWREYSKVVGEGDEIVSDAARFKEALEHGLNDSANWKLPANFANNKEAQALMATTVESLDKANFWFSKYADTFTGPLAKHISLVDENIFGSGVNKPGWMYDDQIAENIFNSFLNTGNSSAMAIKDLAKIVKPKTFKIAARRYIQNAYDASGETYTHTFNKSGSPLAGTTPSKTVSKEKAFLDANPQGLIRDKNGNLTREYIDFQMPSERVRVKGGETKVVDVQIFNPEKFERTIGLGTEQGDDMLKQFYLSMGHNEKDSVKAVQNLKDLMALSKVERSVHVAETAQFVARRAVLAGASGITGAFIATNFGNPLIGVGMAMVARYGSNILTDPKRLQLLTNITNEGLTEKARRANYVRLARLVFGDDEVKDDVPEGLDVTDVDDTMNFLMGSTFAFNDADQEAIIKKAEEEATPFQITPESITQPEKKKFSPSGVFPTNLIPKQFQPPTNVSDEIKTSSLTSNYIRPKGGNLKPEQRAALAGGNLYGAIAQAKHGGIMNLANRRRV